MLKCFLFLLAPFTASWAFGVVAECVYAKSAPSTQVIMYVTKFFAAVAAVLFFGWGFDGCRSKALTTWMVTAVITTVLMIWGVVSSGFYLWPIVTALCWMLRDGGCLFFACHMLYHCDHSEVGVAATIVVYNCLAQLVCFTLLSLFVGSATVQFVFVAVLLVLTIALVL